MIDLRKRLGRDATDGEINLQLLTIQRQAERQAWEEERDARQHRAGRTRANKHAAELRKTRRLFQRNGRKYPACRSTKTMRYGAILAVLEYLTAKFGSKYCYPNQETLLSLLEQYQHITMSRSTLNTDLSELDDMGAITRIRRHRNGGVLGIIFKSTAYYTSKIGKRLLSGLRGTLFFVEKNRVRLFGQYVSLSSRGKGLCAGKGTKTGSDGFQPPLPAT